MTRLSLKTASLIAVSLWAGAFSISQAAPRRAKQAETSGATAAVSPATTEPASATPSSISLTKSYELEAKNDCKGAAASIRSQAEAEPDNYFLRIRLAYLESCALDTLRAAQDYGRAASLDSRSLEALLGQQLALLTLKDFAAAENVGRQILKLDPQSYLGGSRHAWALYSLRRYDQAASAYELLSALYPANVEMWVGLGSSRARAGKRGAALKALQKVLAMVPDEPRATAELKALNTQ